MELAGIEPWTLETLLIKLSTLPIELLDPPKDCWNKFPTCFNTYLAVTEGQTCYISLVVTEGRTFLHWFLVHNLQLEQKFVIGNLSVLPLTLGENTEGRNV